MLVDDFNLCVFFLVVKSLGLIYIYRYIDIFLSLKYYLCHMLLG